MDNILKIILSPLFWLALSAIYLLLYILFRRTKNILPFLNITDVVKNYKKVFPLRRDLLFFLIFPFLLSLTTQFNQIVNEGISNIICVVLSILESTVLTFMAMSNDKYQRISENQQQNLQGIRAKYRNDDAIAIGMYEILVGIVVFILNFIFPSVESHKIISWFVSLFIYWGFYIFVLNIFGMVRRLYQIYFTPNF